MEWSKTKSIIIIALILTNIIVGYFYWQEVRQEMTQSMGEQVKRLESIFSRSGLDIEKLEPLTVSQLPKIGLSLQRVSLEQFQIEGYKASLQNEFTLLLSKGVTRADQVSLEKPAASLEEGSEDNSNLEIEETLRREAIAAVDLWLAQKLNVFTDYHLVNALWSEEGILLYYGQRYQGYFVEGSYMTVVYRDGEVVSLQRRWYDVEEIDGQTIEICSYPMALYRLLDQMLLGATSELKQAFVSVDLGYKLESNAFDTVIESGDGSPYYRFKTAEGKTYLVEALWLQ